MGAVADVNADGLADRVTARVIVPAAATAEDIEAAANIAGRLGYETTSLSLPLVLRDTEVAAADVRLPILVGRQNALVLSLAERGAIDLKALQPGQGLVALVRVGGRQAVPPSSSPAATMPGRWRRARSWRPACRGCGT